MTWIRLTRSLKTSRPVPAKTLAAMLTLKGKKELESDKVNCKRCSKENDFAKGKMKKDTKV